MKKSNVSCGRCGTPLSRYEEKHPTSHRCCYPKLTGPQLEGLLRCERGRLPRRPSAKTVLAKLVELYLVDKDGKLLGPGTFCLAAIRGEVDS